MRTPVRTTVTALPYRPLYGMHRYFARRPHNLFAHLVSHYSDPGDVILDPFFGGGVTVVESLALGRHVVGYDLNPLARFVTEMEVAPFDEIAVEAAVEALREELSGELDELFGTCCPACAEFLTMDWAEVTATTSCSSCSEVFRIAEARKSGVGKWSCPTCAADVRYAVSSSSPEDIIAIRVSCRCGYEGTKTPDTSDVERWREMPTRLARTVTEGRWIPREEIPDCNMQRESALHKKGITQFAQLFSPRVLLGWSAVRARLSDRPGDAATPWLWFAFSAALRYANRMVTRNPGWRGDKPLEWAKPGYWLPPVHLEVNVWQQFERRVAAIRRAKRAPLFGTQPVPGTPRAVARREADYALRAESSTRIDLPDSSVDAVITDPPYGSYVHYADLTNFWTVWLPPDVSPGMGALTDTKHEAVIARKNGFAGAKDADAYRRVLAECFGECYRVLKPEGYMVLTFNNREPRAWLALMGAVAVAGFELPAGGVVFQDGIAQYAHTSQSRRTGSVIGDFVYSFRKPRHVKRSVVKHDLPTTSDVERTLVATAERILARSSVSPRDFFRDLYLELQPFLWRLVQEAGPDRLDELAEAVDGVVMFDSHRRSHLEQHFRFADGRWSRQVA
jgi:putative DNA methylase